MKFSQLAVSAFLASTALAVPVADPNVVTVVETAQEVAYVTAVENVYVTVSAGQEPSATPASSADAAANANVAYVEATVYVDQFGNSVTLGAESAAPATVSEGSLSSPKPSETFQYRHSHSASAASSDPAVVTLTISSAGPDFSSEPSSSPAPVTSQVEAESSAPAPTSSPVTSDVVVVTVSPEPTTTSESSTPAPATSTVEEVSTPSASPDVAQAVETTQDSVASVSTTSSSSSSNLDDFASGCTDLHNSLRAKHSASPLTWNSTLSDYALGYLSKQNCVFEHSGGPYGENIAMGYSKSTDAIQAWYDEVKDYDFSAGQFSMSTGHFTQVVWKETTQVGCNKVDCGDSGSFFACEYYPAGNVIGFFLENVVA